MYSKTVIIVTRKRRALEASGGAYSHVRVCTGKFTQLLPDVRLVGFGVYYNPDTRMDIISGRNPHTYSTLDAYAAAYDNKTAITIRQIISNVTMTLL